MHTLICQQLGEEVMERLAHVHPLVQQQSLYSSQPGDGAERGGEVLEFAEVLFEDLLPQGRR